MNIPRDVMVWMGVLDSERVCRLDPVIQLFFLKLLHLGDAVGRFENNADDIRNVLYRRSRDRVRVRQVTEWLHELHRVGLIVLYTRSGSPYGQIQRYRQRDSLRHTRYPGPQDNEELPLEPSEPEAARPKSRRRPKVAPPDDPPPDPEKSEVNRRESGRKAPSLVPPESNEDRIARLRAKYPDIDVVGLLVKAAVRKQRDGQKLDLAYFERHWLANAGTCIDLDQAVALKNGKPAAAATQPEPDGWRALLVGTAYGEGGLYPAESWSEVCRHRDALAYVRDQLARRAA